MFLFIMELEQMTVQALGLKYADIVHILTLMLL